MKNWKFITPVAMRLESEEQFDYIRYVIPAHNCRVEINISSLDKQLVPDLIDEFVACKECGGLKTVEWTYEGERRTYTNNFDCPVCYGIGNNGKTGKKTPNPRAQFEVDGVVFAYSILKKLVNACKIIGIDTAIKVSGEKDKANLFQVGDFSVLLMPCFPSSDCIKVVL